jgi:hypothetical protein
VTLSPRDRDDLIRLVAEIRAIEGADGSKAAICRELRAKLERFLQPTWFNGDGYGAYTAENPVGRSAGYSSR